MCGRYNLVSSSNDIAHALGFSSFLDVSPRYNIAPSQQILIARRDDHGTKELALVKWGLIPSWVKDVKAAHKPINAQAETAHEKPYFRAAFKRRRCLVPTNGFYEWRTINKLKQPYLFHLPKNALFFFAGLWERHITPDGEVIESAVILTTNPNDEVRAYHDRMPAIIADQNRTLWLSVDEVKTEDLRAVLVPYARHDLEVLAVSPRVNSPRFDDELCIAPQDDAIP